MSLCALGFSHVSRTQNLAGFIALSFQTLLFAILLFAGNSVSSHYIDYSGWNSKCVAAVVAFVFTFVYCAMQIPGKFRLNRLCAWHPGFFEAQQAVAPQLRVDYARKWAASSNSSSEST